ncbi:FAD/NAD(P)-binding domain [Phytophthora cactorum]|nr:FAD/NAD(P)-binding domain [Phytophthora cactorum]
MAVGCADLASLGAKVLFKNFCKSRTYFHVSTRQLQVILLKVALLVGVKVHSATGFQSIVPPAPEQNGGNPFYSIKTEPQIPVVEYTAVLGALVSMTKNLWYRVLLPEPGDARGDEGKEFSWTTQFKHRMLYRMREVGVDLENIVYFRGEMHYIVMTPKRQNLLARGVVKQNSPTSKDLVESTNISQKRVVEFAGIPRRTDFTRVNLFDFSSLTRAEKPASILTSHDKKLSARQRVVVAQIARKSDEQLLADRELAYRVMQRVSGHHRDDLQKNVRKYTVEPRSRYVVDFPRLL